MSTVTIAVVENHLHPFTKNDWYGWAGAEPFPEGDDKEPLISYTEHGVIIVDAVGVAVYTNPPDDDYDITPNFHWGLKLKSQQQAYVIVQGIVLKFLAAQSIEELEALAKLIGAHPI